ncbi:hypothetical protein niasHT_034850 [Heterodera trifolii]|uniref:Ionotropic receptor n=1 Tax=Heterodera trifolii TaxID=157864 RepID=A0ABD2IMB5_9BILA
MNNNRTIRVGFVKYPPAVFNNCANFPELSNKKNCPFPGHCVEFLRIATSKLNLSVEPIVLSHHKMEIDVGSKGTDGQWHGVLGAIANGTVDTGCLFYQKSPPRMADFDYSLPIYSTLSRIAIRDHNSFPLAEMWRLFHPFSVGTWLAIVVFIALHSFVFMAIEKIEFWVNRGTVAQMPTFYNILWRLLRLQLLQPKSVRLATVSGKFALFLFSFVHCVCFTSLYRSWIVTSLVQPKPAIPIRDASSFVKDVQQGKYTFVSQYRGHWFYESLNKSTTFPFKEMRESGAQKKLLQAHSIQESLQMIEKFGNVMLVQGDDPAYFLAAHSCDIVFVDREMPYRTAHLLFRRGSPFTALFNKVIESEKVAIRRSYDRYRMLREMIRNQECEEKMAKSRLYKPLGFVPMFGLLAI